MYLRTKTVKSSGKIYHRNADQVRGHLVGCFLGMYLAIGLRKQSEALGPDAENVEWGRLMQDLRQVQSIRLKLDTREYLVRSELAGSAHLAFRAVGLKPPARVQPIATATGGTAEV